MVRRVWSSFVKVMRRAKSGCGRWWGGVEDGERKPSLLIFTPVGMSERLGRHRPTARIKKKRQLFPFTRQNILCRAVWYKYASLFVQLRQVLLVFTVAIKSCHQTPEAPIWNLNLNQIRVLLAQWHRPPWYRQRFPSSWIFSVAPFFPLVLVAKIARLWVSYITKLPSCCITHSLMDAPGVLVDQSGFWWRVSYKTRLPSSCSIRSSLPLLEWIE